MVHCKDFLKVNTNSRYENGPFKN